MRIRSQLLIRITNIFVLHETNQDMTNFEEIMAYSEDNPQIFDELAGMCIKKMIVPFIGAGLSVFAGFNTWNGFINDQYRACFSNG